MADGAASRINVPRQKLLEIPLDRYERKARLTPAIIVVLPLVLMFFAWFRSGEFGWALFSRLGLTALLAGAVALLLAHIARAFGRSKQKTLFAQWGGSPTLVMLRHRSSGLSSATRRRYHEILKRLLNTDKLPGPEEERLDPDAADDEYQACIDFLLEATRDKEQFYLVFEENVNYGFHRNLWGMKAIGIATSVLGTLGSSALAFLHYRATGSLDDPISLIAVALSLVLLLLWIFVITPEWVRVPAEAYARALLGSCESLVGDASR